MGDHFDNHEINSLILDSLSKTGITIVTDSEDRIVSLSDHYVRILNRKQETDFHGTAANPTGGVYYVSPPDYKTITPVLPNMAIANGAALSPDGKTLWTDENDREQVVQGVAD
jgi:sugar lactone lactonase YvrE